MRVSAAASSFWPRSAAARPSAMRCVRFSIGSVIIGHSHFIVT
jgi:hypothetical protein